ncbi:uncharacterized protein LOC106661448 [Cimex lectularius]|uniref:Uncharacterized protein n=1 Tax=Cimex lectularius TaxID=79782 RepID=A0A8I6R874_CIMLE|nr:uncharacterized protein LOC106661448 [Cimex lectularius]
MSNRDRNENFLSRAKLLTSGTMEEYFKFSSDIIERFLLEKEMRELIAEYDENLSTSDILYGRGAKGFNQETLQKTAKMYLLQNNRDSRLSPDDTLNDIDNHRRRGRNKENDVKFKSKCKTQKHEYAIDDIDNQIGAKSNANNSFTLYPASTDFKFRMDDEGSSLGKDKKGDLQTVSEQPDKGEDETQEKPAKEEYEKSFEPEVVLGDERILNMTFFTDELKSQNIVQQTAEEGVTSNNRDPTCVTPSDYPASSICSACAILKQLDEYERNHYITKTRAQELTELRKLIFQSVDHKIGCRKMRKDIFNKNLEEKDMSELSAGMSSSSESPMVPLKWAKETLRKVGYERAVEFIALTYEEKLQKFKNWIPEFMKYTKTKKKQRSGARRCKARNRGILRRYPRCNNSHDNWKIEGLRDPFYFGSYENTGDPEKAATESKNSHSDDPLFKLTRNNTQGFHLLSDIKVDDETSDEEEIYENVSTGIRNFSKFPENLDRPLKNIYNDALQNCPTSTDQQIEWECHMLSCFPPYDKMNGFSMPTAQLLFENYVEDAISAGIDEKTMAGPSFKYSWTPVEAHDNSSFLDDELPFSYPPPPSPEESELSEYNSDQTMRIVNLFGTIEAEVNNDGRSHCNPEQIMQHDFCDWPINDGFASPEECEDYSIVTTPDPSSDDASDSDSDGSADSLDTVIIKDKHDKEKPVKAETTQLCETNEEKELAHAVAQEIINSLENEIYAVIQQSQKMDQGSSQK